MKLVIAIVASACLCGCGSIINGGSQTILVTSDTGAVPFVVDGSQEFVTPASVTLERSRDHIIAAKGQSAAVPIKHKVSGVTFINIIFPIGFAFDAVGGGMWRLEPEEVRLHQGPVATPNP